MIAKISRGADTAGLLRYLLGPGRANEHSDPHLVASWDGDPAALEPVVVDGRPQVRDLAALLDQPLEALQRRPERTVWHCSLRNAPGDRPLSDDQWAVAARLVLDRVGLAPAGDADGCRWIAARHGDDHVHLLVTLARQDGSAARTPNDYRRAGEACQQLEQRFGLAPTPVRDSTAVRRPSRSEAEKASRSGREESTRETLRREVLIASIVTVDPQAFIDELQRRGLIVKARYSTQDHGRLTGYAVAWPGDHAPGGRPVWFSGSTLAPALSLPRLQQQWDGIRDTTTRSEPSRSHGPPRRAEWAPLIRQLSRIPAAGGSSSLTQATASVLIAVARVLEGTRGGVLTRITTEALSNISLAVTETSSQRNRDQALLSTAHAALRASEYVRPGRSDAMHLERVVLDIVRFAAPTPSQARRTHDQVTAGEVTIHPEGPGGRGRPGASAGMQAQSGPGVGPATTPGGAGGVPIHHHGSRRHR